MTIQGPSFLPFVALPSSAPFLDQCANWSTGRTEREGCYCDSLSARHWLHRVTHARLTAGGAEPWNPAGVLQRGTCNSLSCVPSPVVRLLLRLRSHTFPKFILAFLFLKLQKELRLLCVPKNHCHLWSQSRPAWNKGTPASRHKVGAGGHKECVLLYGVWVHP